MIILIVLMVVAVIGLVSLYNYQLSPVDKSDNNNVIFTIKSGTSTEEIAKNLANSQLIHSDKFFVLYLKINNINNLQASTYKLKRSMSLEEIINIINKGEGYNPNEFAITFKEGENIRGIATTISKATNNSYEDVIKKASDNTYVDSLIEKYWFIKKDVKNKKLMYSLEGYLFPNTYILSSKNVSIEDIFNKMLDQMDKVLSKYKSEIEGSNLSVHEILTLASVVEKEGKTRDFNNIASVFFNRLSKNMKLGSCATSYYGVGMDFNELGIANSEMINNKNVYNTYVISGLPVGPISSVSEDALEAVLKPINTNYLYFLSDNEGNTYFFETYTSHQRKQAELKAAGKWVR